MSRPEDLVEALLDARGLKRAVAPAREAAEELSQHGAALGDMQQAVERIAQTLRTIEGAAARVADELEKRARGAVE